MKICTLTIGDELLEGVILNSNASWLGQELWRLGHALVTHITTPDNLDQIVETIVDLSRDHDVCVISGGLGPTTDDLTVEAIAKACQEELVPDTQQMNRLMAIGLSDERAHTQALRPSQAVAHTNTTGHAPLIEFQLNHCRCFALPGVPKEFKAGVEALLLSSLAESSVYSSRSLCFLNLGESRLAKTVQSLNLSTEIDVRYLAAPPYTYLRLRGRSRDKVVRASQTVSEKLKTSFLPMDERPLLEAIHTELLDRGLRIATAESCTAGQIAAMLANLSGSSGFLVGGIVAYANEIKMKHLNVEAATLETHGAVSEACAREMASNIAQLMHADIGLAVTGIAGPGGGTSDKPVGTVCFAWYYAGSTKSETILFRGDRTSIRRATTVWSLHRSLEIIRA